MKILRLLFLILLTSSPLYAACHAVGPSATGAHTGADWNNIETMPGTFVRGDIYYLQDGTYSPLTISTAVSGTSTVELRKAQSYDFGSTGCGTSIGAGWNTSTMGSGQAVFSGTTAFTAGASFITLNGNGTLTGVAAQGCGGQHTNFAASGSDTTTVTDCGIRLVTTDTVVAIVNRLNSGSTNFTMNYVEEVGTGTNNVNNNAMNAEFGGNSGATFAHNYMRNANCEFFSAIAFQHTVHDNYFWFIQATPSSCHPEAYLMANGSSNTSSTLITDFNNIYRDISGTSVFATVSTGTIFMNVWDDVFFCTLGANCPSTGLDDGIWWCGNTTTCTLNFNNNVAYNLTTGNNNEFVVFQAGASLSGNASNNIAYATTNSPTIQGVTNSNNSWLNSGSGASGTGNVAVTSGAADPFVSAATGNFNLSVDSANYNNRNSTLGSPYNTDAAGNSFTTDRGAYQFISGTPTASAPVFSPAAGTYTSTQTVTATNLSSAPTGCYTTNGSTPATNGTTGCTTGTLYSSSISVASSLTLKMVWGGTSFLDSTVTSAAYVIAPVIATPTASPGAGTYTSSQTVTLTTSTGGSTLCYTTNGSTPAATTAGTCSTGNTLSNGGTTVVATTSTLQVIGTQVGFTNSSVGSYAYTINIPSGPTTTTFGATGTIGQTVSH